MNSWLVFGVKPLHLLVALPLILTRLETNEVAVYYLFQASAGLMLLLVPGFHATFSRIIGYLLSGVSLDGLIANKGVLSNDSELHGAANDRDLSDFMRFMSSAYQWIALFALSVALGLGSFLLVAPMSHLTEPFLGWAAWFVLILCSAISIRTNAYTSFLFGANSVVLLRRCEFAFLAAILISNVLVLIFIPSLLNLILATYLWNPIYFLFVRRVARRLKTYPKYQVQKTDRKILSVVWGPSWRGALGVFTSRGLILISNLLLAQFVQPALVARYGLTMSLLGAANDFSKAPMVSQIPNLVLLRARGSLDLFRQRASRCMLLSYLSYVSAFMGILFMGDIFMGLIGSRVSLAPTGFLCLMGIAYFFDRFSAMHQQIYATRNRVLAHIVGSGYAAVFVLIVTFTISDHGIYAFAWAALFGQLFFAAVVSAIGSYRVLRARFFAFEVRCSLLPLIVLLSAILLALLMGVSA